MKPVRFALAAAMLAACAAPVLPARAQTEAASITAANPLPDTDRQFVQAASMSSSTEIDAGKLAVTHTHDEDVRSFAHRMRADHTKLTVQLKAAAPQGVQVPRNNADTALLDSLKPLRGAEFDRAYVEKVGLEGHRSAVEAFRKEASDGQVPQLKQAAQQALPIIEHHYQMAQALAASKGVAQ
ncbi:DUF4142 domain-containing protein [Burkholderia plantarii]|uniref:DUF4142 domain-containing protein n=1 Tax=Burkholderia plantarii TaxID=41899 RepID=UPI0018DC2525|nr:DUF4142 domain-containing protein [Burkholderia plantarii]MBI0331795.1 DUF4142 domain-containing protein [Burkholderia plantarii]